MKHTALLISILTLLPYVHRVFCTEKEMEQSDQKSSLETSLPCIRESTYAIINFCEQDSDVVDVLLGMIERNYPRIADHLQHRLDKKIIVELYPSLEDFHQAIGCTDGPDWLCTNLSGTNGIIKMVSPLNPGPYHRYDSTLLTMEMSIAGIIVHDKLSKNGNVIPHWFRRGISIYETQEKLPEVLALTKRRISKAFKEMQLPTLESFKYGDLSSPFAGDVGFSYSLVQFIDKKFGYDKVLVLLDNFSAFEEIIGLSLEEFEAQWLEFLNENYFSA